MNKVLKTSFSLALLSWLAACGKAPELPSYMSQMSWPADGSNVDGVYIATFVTLNERVNGFPNTQATVTRQGDQFRVNVRMADGKPHVWHNQAIFAGYACPLESKYDLNHDGMIDFEEGSKVWGKALIPLDNDLSSQLAGFNSYPSTDYTGAYTYERRTSFQKMFDDLKTEDDNPHDFLMKLKPDQGFSIDGSVIVIFGTSSNEPLPETVAARPNQSQAQSFPVACGLLKKVNAPPDIGSGNTSTGTTTTAPVPAPIPEPVPEPVPTPVPPVTPTPPAPTTPSVPEPPTTPTNPDVTVGPSTGSSSSSSSSSSSRTRPRPTRSSEESDADWMERLADWFRNRWREVREDIG